MTFEVPKVAAVKAFGCTSLFLRVLSKFPKFLVETSALSLVGFIMSSFPFYFPLSIVVMQPSVTKSASTVDNNRHAGGGSASDDMNSIDDKEVK